MSCLCFRILDLVITVLIQVIFMRDLEKLISTWRVLIIYFGSNLCGSLASATFLPYYVEVRTSTNSLHYLVTYFYLFFFVFCSLGRQVQRTASLRRCTWSCCGSSVA